MLGDAGVAGQYGPFFKTIILGISKCVMKGQSVSFKLRMKQIIGKHCKLQAVPEEEKKAQGSKSDKQHSNGS